MDTKQWEKQSIETSVLVQGSGQKTHSGPSVFENLEVCCLQLWIILVQSKATEPTNISFLWLRCFFLSLQRMSALQPPSSPVMMYSLQTLKMPLKVGRSYDCSLFTNVSEQPRGLHVACRAEKLSLQQLPVHKNILSYSKIKKCQK